MIAICKWINTVLVECGNILEVELEEVDYYRLYMDNDMTKILDEIPTEELEAYLKKRVENDK